MSKIKVYSVKGGNRGKTVQVVSDSKQRAIEVAGIQEMGKTTVEIIDANPTFKEVLSGIGEPTHDIEWYDGIIKEWTCNILVDEALYDETEYEIISKQTKGITS